jgi:polyisoprenoid-binding protein YceI
MVPAEMNTLSEIDAATPTGESPFDAVAATWGVDPDQSVARFSSATLWGRVPVSGRLGRLRGTLSWDGAGGHGRLAIATAGLSSGIKLRDHHLRSGAFFDVDNHPELTFEASVVIVIGGHVQLRGHLFVRGRRHPFECTATVEAVDEDRVALEACAEVDLDELGMSRGLLRMIPARVSASVRVVLEREPA